MGQKISGKNFTRLTVGCFKGGFKVGGTEWGVTGVAPHVGGVPRGTIF